MASAVAANATPAWTGSVGTCVRCQTGACRRDEQRAKRTIHYSRWATVACGYDYSLAVKKDGTLWAWGHNYVGQLGLGDTTTRLTPTDLPPFVGPLLAIRRKPVLG